MTNAIEQAKREMYGVLSNLSHLTNKAENRALEHYESATLEMQLYQCKLEAYLELLRQDHEALHETARARFEDIGKLEAANQELIQRLAKMVQERDSIQLRLHAVDHAYKTQQGRAETPTKDSGDRASCATTDAKTMTILGAFVDIQRIVTNWAMKDVRAKAAMREIARVANGSVEVSTAMTEFEKDRCMHSFFAIGKDKMKCAFCGVGK